MDNDNEKLADDGTPPAHRRGVGDYYLTPGEENRIIAKLLACKRWKATDKHKDAALGVTVRNMNNKDGRVSNAAVSNLIKMEAQNQTDEHKMIPKKHEHTHAIAYARTRRLAELDEYLGFGRVVDEAPAGDASSDPPAAITAG